MEKKESFWKGKGFYFSVCVLLVGVMAVGAVCYRGQGQKSDDNQMMANIATELPDHAADSAGIGAAKSEEKKEDSAQANANLVPKLDQSDVAAQAGTEDGKQEKTKKEEDKAGAQKKKKQDKDKKAKETPKAADNSAQKTPAVQTTSNAAERIQHSFNEEKGLLWPVQGDVLLKYSMKNTVYFKTLAQYKCNPGIMISAKVGKKVKAAADCRVTRIRKDAELGTIVTTDIGSDYRVSYGQLDNISVNKGDELKEGDVIGTVASPTKYFSEEGSNLYFEVRQSGETVDPMLLLR